MLLLYTPLYFAKNSVHDIRVTFLQKILSMTSVSHFCKKSCPWHQFLIFAKNPVHDISVTFLQKRPVHDISVTLLQKRRMLFCVKLSYFFVHIYILPVISLFFTSFFCLSCVFTPTEKTQKVMIMKNAANFWRRK